MVHLLRKLSTLEYKNIGVLGRIIPMDMIILYSKRVKIAVEFRLLMSRF